MAEMLSWDEATGAVQQAAPAVAASKPFDSSFNTKLNPADETAFTSWKTKYAPKDSGDDYDLRGAFKAGLQPDVKTGHWPDTFKKPNHPTFSDQSKYAPYGNPGSWKGDTYVPGVAKTGQVVSWEEATGLDPLVESVKASQQPAQVAKDVAKDVAKYTAGSLGTAADMVLGIPGMVGQYFTHVTGRVGAQVSDPSITQKEAAGAGAEYAQQLVPEWAMSPLKSAISALSPEARHYFDNSPLGQVMGAVTGATEKGAAKLEAKSGIPTEDLQAGINGLMAGLGAKGAKAAAIELKQRIEMAALRRSMAAKQAVQEDTSVPYDTEAGKEAAGKVELDAQIKAAAQARKDTAKKVKEAAKYQKMAEKEEDPTLKDAMQKRADIALQELADAQAAAKAASDGKAAEASAAKSADLEDRIGGTAAEVGGEPASDTPSSGDLHRILTKPGFERSAEEIMSLRRAAKNGLVKGYIDPELHDRLIRGVVYGGLGATAALYGSELYKTYARKKEVEEQQRNLDLYDKLHDEERDRLNAPVVPNPGSDPSKPIFTAAKDMSRDALTTLLLSGGVLGSVRMKGVGSWHPEAVERLSAPLHDKLGGREEFVIQEGIRRGEISADATDREMGNYADKVAAATKGWSDKSIRNYLNKHAGTEGDPLKDVELPSGKKWGALTDKAIQGSEVSNPARPPYHETQWNITDRYTEGNESTQAIHEMTSYLSHVGDYLRQNVDPAKLQQYDLVRAVKETAANDARVAKEMEKAATASMKDMPVYKDYGDGMKWVELKLPEKLTEEQRARIKKLESASERADAQDRHVALDPQGKEILNSYTGRPATAPTPEEAHLAGRLAEEGNQMGHCVGGYCADVASGQTRILSLRDAKGRSHVTVEIAPQQVKAEGKLWGEFAEQRRAGGEQSFDTWVKEAHPELKNEHILQIKGKQNRAPNAEYLPYVQDLVKGGKWGEVGDLENTGLHDTQPSRNNSKQYNALAEEFHPGQRYITEKELEALQHEGIQRTLKENEATLRRNQLGSADVKQLATIAATVGGAALAAYLDPESPLWSAAKGAAAGLLLTSIRPTAVVELARRMTKEGPTVRIDQLANETTYNRAVARRAAYGLSQQIEKKVPEVKRREEIFRFLDGENVKLNSVEQAVAATVRAYYDSMGAAAKAAGVIREVLDDYATRIYGPEGRSLFAAKTVGGNMPLESPFGKRRYFVTLQEALAAGHVPVSIDIAKVLEPYTESVVAAIENRKFIKSVRETTLPDGTKLIEKEGKAPRDYTFIDHPQLRGFRVHPDIAADLNFLFGQKEVGPVLRALDAVNTTQKRMAVSFSLFHAMALEHAMLGATSLLKSPLRGLKVAAQSFAPLVFGESLAVKMIREGGVGDVVDAAMKDGLQFGFERASPALQELQSNFYNTMTSVQGFLDKQIPQLGTQTVGRFQQVNHMFDRAMWGRFHATMKLETYMDKVAELSRNDAARAAKTGQPVKSREEIGKIAASFTNDVFGGLNWQGIAQEFSSRWGRELASSVLGPAGRFGMRLVLFAPDWTISTTRAFLKAFGQQGVAAGAGAVLGSQVDPENAGTGALLGAALGAGAGRALGLKGTGSSGVMGMVKPTELADLHRQYVLRSAFIYSTVADAVNYQLSGHHFWENKDPTRIDTGDGRTMQASKHFMEPFHWLLNPRQQALNKLSFAVKEPLEQVMDREYLSAHDAPRMGLKQKGEEISLGDRAAHLAKKMNPIAVQQSWEGSVGKGVAGFMGYPIYGKSYEERAAAKEIAKQKAVQRRIDKRAKEQ